MARRTQSGHKGEGGHPQLEPDVPAAQTGSMADGTSRLDLITRRAYERFQMRGGEHGRDQEDWLEAERELNPDTQE
jgi:hypothetical protein